MVEILWFHSSQSTRSSLNTLNKAEIFEGLGGWWKWGKIKNHRGFTAAMVSFFNSAIIFECYYIDCRNLIYFEDGNF